MKRIYSLLLVAVVACSLCGCHHHDQEEHHHEGEPITVYGPRLELFAEAQPMVVGEECEVLAHLTRLDDFKPLEGARVTMTLRVEGAEPTKVSLDGPEKPGIYHFAITPTKAGCGSLTFEVAMPDSSETLQVKHIHVVATHDALHEHEHGHEHAHEHEHEHEHAHVSADAIAFTKEQSWKVDFATDVVQPTQFGQLIKTVAQVMPSQGDMRTVSAKTSGIVVFANPNLVEGTAVKAGQRLFSIESGGMADNNMNVKFQESSANYTLAMQNYERKQQLAKDRIVSQSELERAKTELDNAAAVYNNLKGNFSQSGQSISAPMGGYVTHIAVSNGGYVEAGQTVVTVAQNRDLFVRAEVQPRHYEALGHILSASIRLPNDERVYSMEELGGGLVSYGRAADADDPLVPVTFRVHNSANLLSGSFVDLYIRTASDEEVIALPNTGIVEQMGSHFVFVQVNPELFEKRLVTLGATDGIRTVVTSGLKAGERVVTKGAVMVKLAQTSGAMDPHAGHVH